MTTDTHVQVGGASVSMRLLGDFELKVDGETVDVAHSSQRLLGFLALQGRAVQRTYAGGMLWLEAPESKASGCLRSAIWRVPSVDGFGLLSTTPSRIGLDPRVRVDLYEATAQAHQILHALPGELLTADLLEEARLFGEDVLLGWYDDWVVMERERFRQIRLHALDRLSEHLLVQRRYADALEISLNSVEAEPLRETSHRLVVRVHLAEGNLAEAVRHFRRYEVLLDRELGVGPSSAMRDLLVEGLGRAGEPGRLP